MDTFMMSFMQNVRAGAFLANASEAQMIVLYVVMGFLAGPLCRYGVEHLFGSKKPSWNRTWRQVVWRIFFVGTLGMLAALIGFLSA